MESMQYDKYVALDILNRVHISIEHIEERSQPYHCGDDFLMSSTGVAILDSICMQFIAIGESLIPQLSMLFRINSLSLSTRKQLKDN